MTIDNRIYHDGSHDDVVFFVGNEVEHTPAHGERTLFVVGLRDPEMIHAAAVEHRCDHIYFGANQSFDPARLDRDERNLWVKMIQILLSRSRPRGLPKYLCTLDVDVSQVEYLLETGLTEKDNFIPMISVKVPYADHLGYNATIKLDDVGFSASNPGVWCHNLRSLMDRRSFTSWREYSNDEVID